MLMDIYVRAGKYDQIERIYKRSQLDVVSCNLLIKSLGNADMADKATALLKNMLAESRVNPDVYTFNRLINAWAESSQPDAVAQASAVLRLMNEDPKCIQLGLRPNIVIFGSLLKCISNSNSSDAGKKAVEILDEMERRYQAGENEVKPNVICFNLAIKACLRSGDADRVEALMERMEKSDTPPDIRTYSDILNNLSKAATTESAERTEQILSRMKQLAKTDSPALKPNVYAYNIAMNAWSKSGHSESAMRMWRLYEQMKEDNVEPDVITFNTLITFFSYSKERVALEQADSLLQSMEKSERRDMRPDHRHYAPVVKGWCSLCDMEKATRVLMCFINAPGANPSPAIIGSVIQGWIKANDLDRATLLIDKMQALKDSNVLPEVPNFRSYETMKLHLLGKADYETMEIASTREGR